jgi:hypothetical protein
MYVRPDMRLNYPAYPCYIMHNIMEYCRSRLRIAEFTSIKWMLFHSEEHESKSFHSIENPEGGASLRCHSER